MATTRGHAKKNIQRAKNNAGRIVERLFYLVQLYSDYPEWTEAVKVACVQADALQKFIGKILEKVP